MSLTRRWIVSTCLGGAGLLAGAQIAVAKRASRTTAAASLLPDPAAPAPAPAASAPVPAQAQPADRLSGSTEADQTASLQAAIDAAAARGVPLVLPAGRIKTCALTLRPGSVLIGASGLTTLVFNGTGAWLGARDAANIKLIDLKLDGGMRPLDPERTRGLIAFNSCAAIELRGVGLTQSAASALALNRCTGRITGCTITQAADSGIFALDSTLSITGNVVSDCGNNGILVWRSTPAEDGSHVSGNTISKIRAERGGTGENGNGVNVYRAGGVRVSDNRITDCSYSAIRGNAASNIQMVGNACQRLGEVALYAEFGFEGALIQGNLVDGAATGISVTNFDVGGRLAVVQGNLIRNLVRREHEPEDKRGEGIAVCADTTVTGNTIENAPTAGILIGWGPYMRDCTATGNLIRGATVGIMISAHPGGGSCYVQGNTISGAKSGAIRAMNWGRVTGPDLVREPPPPGRVTVTGNVAS
jgi:uncharacterized secreted repeat protein (TIGR03808 family)